MGGWPLFPVGAHRFLAKQWPLATWHLWCKGNPLACAYSEILLERKIKVSREWFYDDAVAARDAAAEGVRAELARDRARSPAHLARFLTHLEEHLFDPGYTVKAGRLAAGMTRTNLKSHFRRRLDSSPRTYLRAFRLRVAETLTMDTSMPIEQVAEMSGFTSRPMLTRAFRECFGTTPSALRNRLPAADSPQLLDQAITVMARAVRRRSSLSERAELVRRIATAVGLEQVEGVSGTPSAALHWSADAAARLDLEVGWKWLRGLPRAGQQAMIEGQAHRFPGLFDFLKDQSRKEGRGNRQRGVEIAELALLSLESRHLDVEVAPERLRATRARAYAWLGNAQRLALDLSAAARNLAEAERLARAKQTPPAVRAEVWELQASLDWYRGNFEDARMLAGKAIGALYRLPDQRLLAKAMLVRAHILIDSGLASDALADLDMVLDLFSQQQERTRLEVIALQLLARAHIEVGLARRAAPLLRRADQICAELGTVSLLPYNDWGRAQIAREARDFERARTLLRRACQGFESVGETFYQAWSAVELADTLVELRQHGEAVAMIKSVLPLFDAMAVRREGLAARRLLTEAMMQDVKPVAVQGLLKHLIELRKQPASLAALRDLARPVGDP